MTEKQLIINVNLAETRIALLENGNMAEIFIERVHDQGIVGNIFKGIVTRVLPGMNSAFVDIGLDKSAFLFGGDVWDPEHEKTALSLSEDGDDKKLADKRPIEKVLRDGQEIIVQVAKEPLGTKGPRVTMYQTIPGRFLVLMPNFSHIGISRRIEQEEERERLKQIVEGMVPEGAGVIIRTAAIGVEEEVLQKDLAYLIKLWHQLEKAISVSRPPSLLHKDLDVVQKVTRDLYSHDINNIIIDDHDTYDQLGSFLKATIPGAYQKLSLYTDQTPIFDVYGVEIDIGRALGERVELPSGGYLIIEQTEALTSFDVNTGRFVGKANARHTILSTNIEAAKKVVEQLRIRNIGGIIIVDFIDMEDPVDRELIYDTLLEELKADRARTNVLRVSELGLVQMTRKRTSESLERRLLTACPFCDGKGSIRSTETEAYDLLREIHRHHIQTGCTKMKVRVRPEIREWIEKKGREFFEQLKNLYQIDVKFEKTQLNQILLREPAYEVWSDNE